LWREGEGEIFVLEVAPPLTVQLVLGSGVILGEGKEGGAIDREFEVVEGGEGLGAGCWGGVSQENEIYVVGVALELEGGFNWEGVDEVLEYLLI